MNSRFMNHQTKLSPSDIGIRKRVKWTRGGWRLEVGINGGDHLELKTVKMKLKRNATNNKYL